MATQLVRVRTQLIYQSTQSENSAFHLDNRYHSTQIFILEAEWGLPTFVSTVLQAGPDNRVILVPRENLSHSDLRNDLSQPPCCTDKEINFQQS